MKSQKENELNQRIKRALSRLTQTQKIFLYVQLRIWLLWYHVRPRFLLLRYAIYRFRHWLKYPSPRALVHWAGASNRPRRLERVFIAFVLVGGFFALEPLEYLIWAAGWGSLASVFVIWQSIKIMTPRRQYHWLNK